MRKMALSTAELAAASAPVPPGPVVDLKNGTCKVNLKQVVRINGTVYGPGEGIIVPTDASSVWANALAMFVAILTLCLSGQAMAQPAHRVCFETGVGTVACTGDAIPVRDYPVGTTATFSANFSGVANTRTAVRAAPAAGFSIYVTDIVIQTTTATSGTFTFQSGTGGTCGTATATVTPTMGAPVVSAAPLVIQFKTPIKLTTIHELCLTGVATNTVSGVVNGFVAP